MKRAATTLFVSLCILGAGLAGAQSAEAKNFHFLKPEGLLNSPGYSQAVRIDGGKLVILAGQMPVDEKGWDPLESTCRHASLSIL